MTEQTLPTAKELREAFSYDPETGFLRWLHPPYKSTRHTSSYVGWVTTGGYIQIKYRRRRFQAHRVIWCIVTGDWPKDQIDHINLNRADNRWANLREATAFENQRNVGAQRNNATGIKGVFVQPDTQRWCARIRLNGKLVSLGCFDTPEEASAAYNRRASLEFGEFFRPSRIV